MIEIEVLKQVTHIITHANCPDGIASAMILKDALPDAEVTFLQYGTPEMTALAAKPGMLFCDITPPRERVQEFADAGAVVLDHHKGAKDIVEAFGERGVFADEVTEPGVSGAFLAYRHVYGPWLHEHNRITAALLAREDRVNDFARLAGVRDTWQTTSEYWKEACAQAEVLMFLGAERLLAERNAHLSEEDMDLGRTLLLKKLKAADEITEHGLLRVGDWLLFNDGDRRTSDVAEAARKRYPDANGVAGFHYAVQSDGTMRLVFSLRSGREGVDVAAIAKANGGGGHTRAAGFSVPVRTSPIFQFERALVAASWEARHESR